MKEMSDKFNSMGQQVYVDAEKVKAPHTAVLDSEAAHATRNKLFGAAASFFLLIEDVVPIATSHV